MDTGAIRPVLTHNFDVSTNEYQSITCTVSILKPHSYIGGLLEAAFLETLPQTAIIVINAVCILKITHEYRTRCIEIGYNKYQTTIIACYILELILIMTQAVILVQNIYYLVTKKFTADFDLIVYDILYTINQFAIIINCCIYGWLLLQIYKILMKQ